MSPESTAEYYQHITHRYTERYGDYGYPEIIIYSVSFQSYVDWPNQNCWDLVGQGLSEAARKLEAAGADLVVIAHRPRTIADADQILVVDSGPIVEQGKHQESVEKGGFYSRMKQTHIAEQGWGLAV